MPGIARRFQPNPATRLEHTSEQTGGGHIGCDCFTPFNLHIGGEAVITVNQNPRN